MAGDSDLIPLLQANRQRLEERILKACAQAGRSRDSVLVLPITKYVDAPVIQTLMQLGFTHFGESRPQAIWEKSAQIPAAGWHFVGHLQRNKIARTLPLVSLIHSVDSRRLLQAIDEEAAKIGKTCDVLLELHLSGEQTKQGFTESDWPSLPEWLAPLRQVRVRGLMCMAALESAPQEALATFARLRELRDQWRSGFPEPHSLDHLSMGMTNDFCEAVQEGATIIRIGSAFFEGL